jgi:hypothetical protein
MIGMRKLTGVSGDYDKAGVRQASLPAFVAPIFRVGQH